MSHEILAQVKAGLVVCEQTLMFATLTAASSMKKSCTRTSIESAAQDVLRLMLQAHEMVGQVKARLAVSERELILVRQEAEGSSKSGSALGQELHAVKRQSAALQQQLNSVQAELEEGAAKHQIEVRLLCDAHGHQQAAKHAKQGCTFECVTSLGNSPHCRLC